MRKFTNRGRVSGLRGFTLIEVIIATGILAVSVLAVIAFLGATGHATSEAMDRTAAARIADNVRAELDTVDIGALATQINPTTPLVLFASKDGERVRLGSGPYSNVNNAITATPPGIPERSRYFKIEVYPALKNLDPSTWLMSDSTILPLSVQVIWPHHLPQGPADPVTGAGAFTAVVDVGDYDGRDRQSRYIFNTTLLRK